MSAKEMVMQLKNQAEEGEIQESEVPEVKTVEGWITRYSASLRKEAAEQRVLRETNKDLKMKVIIVGVGKKDYNLY